MTAPKRVLCAPDAFKGTIDAADAAEAMARGVRAAGHEPICCPIADGGEGTAALLADALDGTMHEHATINAAGEPITATFAMLPDGTAIIESAAASGLPQLPAHQRKPMGLTSMGTGELLQAAIDAGASALWLCIGGTATVDGGLGLLQALGTRCVTAEGMLPVPALPPSIDTLHELELPLGLPPMRGLIDTAVPLLGDEGAARVFAPQKGATPEEVDHLETLLTHLATIADPENLIRHVPGAGAGGGMGFAVALTGGALESGAEVVLHAVGLHDALQDADLVLTGEGRLDGQTATGKAPMAVAQAAHHAGVPCIGIAGVLDGDLQALMDDDWFADLRSLADHCGIEAAMLDPAAAIEAVTCAALTPSH